MLDPRLRHFPGASPPKAPRRGRAGPASPEGHAPPSVARTSKSAKASPPLMTAQAPAARTLLVSRPHRLLVARSRLCVGPRLRRRVSHGCSNVVRRMMEGRCIRVVFLVLLDFLFASA